jgi:hypothetical protein
MMWLGISTLIVLIIVAKIGYLLSKGNPNVKFQWHKYAAVILIIVALIHGTLGILHFF